MPSFPSSPLSSHHVLTDFCPQPSPPLEGVCKRVLIMSLVPRTLNIAHASFAYRDQSVSSALVPASPDLALQLLNSLLIFYDVRSLILAVVSENPH